MRIINLLCLLITASYAHAQVVLQFVDVESKAPIEGVDLRLQDHPYPLITDQAGQVNTELALPLQYYAQHVAYKPDSGIITKRNQVIYLHPITKTLDEVLITGQIQPTTKKNSVYHVTTISHSEIKALGANTLNEVLQQQLNIQFSRDNALGTSSISLQGLSGQYVKILIDGIPVSGRSGVNNEIDLSQIDIQHIDHIEIVEGPMAVNYGADALAGVINIITKKRFDQKWQAHIALQESTIGDAYSLFDEGTHNPAITFGMNISSSLLARASISYRKSGGWIGNGTNRNRQWYPKTQLLSDAFIRYHKHNITLDFHSNYLNEDITNLGDPTQSDLYDPVATDEVYHAQRHMHAIQSSILIGDKRLQTDFSYTYYRRTTEQYQKNLYTEKIEVTDASEQDTTLFNTLYLKSSLNQIPFSSGTLQLGINANRETAEGTTLSDGEKTAYDISGFIVAEINLTDHLFVRPGIRYGYFNRFEATPTPSLDIKYDGIEQTSIRFNYGRGFRTPSLREMYHEFIDANHRILGNSNLKPEYSHHFGANITYDIKSTPLTSQLSAFYNNVTNLIGYISTADNNTDIGTTYKNIATYKSKGLKWNVIWKFSHFNANAGIAYTGTYHDLSDDISTIPQYVYFWEYNTNLQYKWAKHQMAFNAFYKYNGATKNYVETTSDNSTTSTESQHRDAFHWLTLSVSKRIGHTTDISVGVKNVLDVTTVPNTYTSTSAHADNSGQTSVATGRNYFIQLNISLQSNHE